MKMNRGVGRVGLVLMSISVWTGIIRDVRAELIETLWNKGVEIEFREPQDRDVFEDKVRKGSYNAKNRKIEIVLFEGVEIGRVIRHEAWHAAQHCLGMRVSGSGFGSGKVAFGEILSDKEVVESIRQDEFKSVVAMYPIQVVRLELEAKIAEGLRDETVEAVVNGLCK